MRNKPFINRFKEKDQEKVGKKFLISDLPCPLTAISEDHSASCSPARCCVFLGTSDSLASFRPLYHHVGHISSHKHYPHWLHDSSSLEWSREEGFIYGGFYVKILEIVNGTKRCMRSACWQWFLARWLSCGCKL